MQCDWGWGGLTCILTETHFTIVFFLLPTNLLNFSLKLWNERFVLWSKKIQELETGFKNETILLLLQVRLDSRCAFAFFVAPGIEHAKCFFLFLNLNCSFSFTYNSQMPTFTSVFSGHEDSFTCSEMCVKTPYI